MSYEHADNRYSIRLLGASQSWTEPCETQRSQHLPSFHSITLSVQRDPLRLAWRLCVSLWVLFPIARRARKFNLNFIDHILRHGVATGYANRVPHGAGVRFSSFGCLPRASFFLPF
jgi:hypothetical protein